MSAYYNENDAEKAAWLAELIRENVVADGEVDERSIEQVEARDLRGFSQCHFFAGIGVWSYALRLAGWPDDRPVWTGSCPCPSFSAAGKGGGFDDPRHLWPAWYRLIPESNPPTIFGEQADDAIGYGWLDLVQTDLERAHYAVGKAVLGACSVGAPHIRQRLYFCAHSERAEVLARSCEVRAGAGADECHRSGNGRRSVIRGLSHGNGSFARREASTAVGHGNSADTASCPSKCADSGRASRHAEYGNEPRPEVGRKSTEADPAGAWARSEPGECTDTECDGCGTRPTSASRQESRPAFADNGSEPRVSSDTAQRRLAMRRSPPGDTGHFALTSQSGIGSESISEGLEGFPGDVREWRGPGWLDPHTARSVAAAGATRGFWGDCDWWHARDEKYRPIEPGLFPLVTGAANRVLKLRGYGDAIVSEVAKAFIEAYLEL